MYINTKIDDISIEQWSLACVIGNTFESNIKNSNWMNSRVRFKVLYDVSHSDVINVNLPSGFKIGIHEYNLTTCIKDSGWISESSSYVLTSETTHVGFVLARTDNEFLIPNEVREESILIFTTSRPMFSYQADIVKQEVDSQIIKSKYQADYELGRLKNQVPCE